MAVTTGGSSAVGPSISAVVCTHDRPEQLDRALNALLAQRPPSHEILVVDNAPCSAGAHELVRRRYPSVRYTLEPLAGLSFARNRALREARGDVVAFTDDDAVVSGDWTSAMAQVFSTQPQVAVCTGLVEALTIDTPGARMFEANGGFGRGDEVRQVGQRRRLGVRPLIAWTFALGTGCSLAVRRDIALSIGGFDEALDAAPLLPAAGDLDFLWRVLQAGYDVRYDPRVRVRHEHRATEDGVLNQLRDYHLSLSGYLEKALRNATGRDRLTVAIYLLWRLLKPGARLALRLAGREPLPASALLSIWGASWRGLGRYERSAALARRRRDATPEAA